MKTFPDWYPNPGIALTPGENCFVQVKYHLHAGPVVLTSRQETPVFGKYSQGVGRVILVMHGVVSERSAESATPTLLVRMDFMQSRA